MRRDQILRAIKERIPPSFDILSCTPHCGAGFNTHIAWALTTRISVKGDVPGHDLTMALMVPRNERDKALWLSRITLELELIGTFIELESFSNLALKLSEECK